MASRLLTGSCYDCSFVPFWLRDGHDAQKSRKYTFWHILQSSNLLYTACYTPESSISKSYHYYKWENHVIMDSLFRIMQWECLYVYIIITHYYFIITKRSIITHYLVCKSQIKTLNLKILVITDSSESWNAWASWAFQEYTSSSN